MLKFFTGSDSQGRTALHLAAEKGDEDRIEQLLAEDKVQIDKKDNLGRTPLYLAAANNHVGSLGVLLLAGANMQVEATDGSTAIEMAKKAKHAESVFLLETVQGIEAYKSEKIADIVKDVETLYYFSAMGNYDYVSILLALGVDPNQRTKERKTPLHAAAELHDQKMIQILIEGGADIHAKDNASVSPLDMVRDKNPSLYHTMVAQEQQLEKKQGRLKKYVRRFLESEKSQSKLHQAAMRNDPDSIRSLVGAGHKINETDSNGSTPLHIAAEYDNVKAIEALYKAGEVLNKPDKAGNTPLFVALQKGHVATILVLCSHGVSIHQPNKEGLTPICFAAKNGLVDSIPTLLLAGAAVGEAISVTNDAKVLALLRQINELEGSCDENFRQLVSGASSYQNVLSILIRKGHLAAFKALVVAGFNVNERWTEESPLHVAVGFGSEEATRILLQAGAKVDCQDKDNNTSLHIAVERMGFLSGPERSHMMAITHLLLGAGAAKYVKNNKNETPLEIAKRQGNQDIIKLLEPQQQPTAVNSAASSAWGPPPVAPRVPAGPAITPPPVTPRAKPVIAAAQPNIMIERLRQASKAGTDARKTEANAYCTDLDRLEKEAGTLSQGAQHIAGTLRQEIAQDTRAREQIAKDQGQLRLQNQSLMASLLAKQNTPEMETIVKELTITNARITELETKMSGLIVEIERKRKIQEAIQQFNHNPNLVIFYRTVQIKLEEIFISTKAVAGGFVPAADGQLAMAQTIVQGLADVATLVPVVGPAAAKFLNWTNTAIGMVDNARQTNIAQNASALLTLSEMMEMAEAVARQLTICYGDQLDKLATLEEVQQTTSALQRAASKAQETILLKAPQAPAQQLACYAVLWMTDVIYAAKDMTHASLDNLLLTHVTRKAPPEKIEGFWNEICSKLKLEGLPTKKVNDKTDIWKPAEILTLPGVKVRTVDGTAFMFYTSSKLKPIKYGYRQGTEEDVKVMNLTVDPTKHNVGRFIGEMARINGQMSEMNLGSSSSSTVSPAAKTIIHSAGVRPAPAVPARATPPINVQSADVVNQSIKAALKIATDNMYYHEDINPQEASALIVQHKRRGAFIVSPGSTANAIVIHYMNLSLGVERMVFLQVGHKFRTPKGECSDLTACFGKYMTELKEPLVKERQTVKYK